MEARTQKGKQYKQNQLEKSTKGKKRMSCFTSFSGRLKMMVWSGPGFWCTSVPTSFDWSWDSLLHMLQLQDNHSSSWIIIHQNPSLDLHGYGKIKLSYDNIYNIHLYAFIKMPFWVVKFENWIYKIENKEFELENLFSVTKMSELEIF